MQFSKASWFVTPDSFGRSGLTLRSTPALPPQAPPRHSLGCAVAWPVALGHLVWLGAQGGAHDRKHGRSCAGVRCTTTADPSTQNPAAPNPRSAPSCAHQHSTSHHTSPNTTRSGTCRAGHSHRSHDPGRGFLCQARLPQRLSPLGRRRHRHFEVFNWCRWQSAAGRY